MVFEFFLPAEKLNRGPIDIKLKWGIRFGQLEACVRMMSNLFIAKSIAINAPLSRVWRVFTDPVLTRKMGGEYVSEWKAGSPLGWKGLDGKMITNGSIMEIIPASLLQHTLLDSVGTTNSVIIYEFQEENGVTILYAREDFAIPVTDREDADAAEGWDAALQAVKETAERTE
jgi:uncharacterized protein YndB with AHSA1/START domain